jgi:hypothetical protein
MLRTNCWNCGARVNGLHCQMCGAMQGRQADEQAAPQPPRPPRPAAPGGYGPNSAQKYVPGGQPGEWYRHIEPEEEYAPGPPDQDIDIAKSYGMRGFALSPGAPGYVPGGKPPSLYPEMLAPEPLDPAPSVGSRVAEALSVPLATLRGGIAGIICAALWAALLIGTQRFFTYLAFLLGIGVGLGVALGARGHHDIGLSLFAGLLGVLSYCLGLYFAISLDTSQLHHAGINFFALSLNDFSNVVGDFLELNPINFINFVLVPLAAMGTAYKFINRGRDGVS